MKSILLVSSIIICSLFSSFVPVNANKGAIDSLLNLEFGVENIKYQLVKFEEKRFSQNILQKKYNKLAQINNFIIDEFYKEYTAGNIDYYSTHGIIINQKLFAHSATKMFEYIELKILEDTTAYDSLILEQYSDMRTHYNRITAIYDKARKQ